MEDLSPEASARLGVITRNADHLLALTARFLDDLHPVVDLHRQRVTVRSLVDDAMAVLLAAPGFAERDVSVDVDEALQVLADPQAISGVVTNLIGNAAKFSSAADRITIAAGEDDAWVSLTVKNTGSRIDTEDLERIFDRFYRGANAQRDAVAGTGIGLSVSRQIALAHGGALTAEEVGEGASFRFDLPRG
jgi:signal transduction histidine kinase